MFRKYKTKLRWIFFFCCLVEDHYFLLQQHPLRLLHLCIQYRPQGRGEKVAVWPLGGGEKWTCTKKIKWKKAYIHTKKQETVLAPTKSINDTLLVSSPLYTTRID